MAEVATRNKAVEVVPIVEVGSKVEIVIRDEAVQVVPVVEVGSRVEVVARDKTVEVVPMVEVPRGAEAVDGVPRCAIGCLQDIGIVGLPATAQVIGSASIAVVEALGHKLQVVEVGIVLSPAVQILLAFFSSPPSSCYARRPAATSCGSVAFVLSHLIVGLDGRLKGPHPLVGESKLSRASKLSRSILNFIYSSRQII
jgi:hypothetical protein